MMFNCVIIILVDYFYINCFSHFLLRFYVYVMTHIDPVQLVNWISERFYETYRSKLTSIHFVPCLMFEELILHFHVNIPLYMQQKEENALERNVLK